MIDIVRKGAMAPLKNIILMLLVILAVTSCNKDEVQVQEVETLATPVEDFSGDGAVIPDKYIITFAKDAVSEQKMKSAATYEERKGIVKAAAENILTENHLRVASIDHVYSKTIQGVAITLSEGEIAALSKDPRVSIIEPDRVIALGPGGNKPAPTPTQPAQTTPWGINRVGGSPEYTGTHKAWIIDTGIDLDHPDLNVNTSLSTTFIANSTPDDQNGHGTHVAGTIAAINNSIGVIGVAPGAEVVAVRVLDRRGSGSISGVIAGVDYVAAHAAAGDVANMSLGGGASTSLDNAVMAASNLGIWFAIAAGNSSVSATTSSPARVNGPYVVTVSAMSSGDNWASFSNYGNPPVDFCAPGVSVYSTWKSAGYNTISGTSMATPHIAGVILVNGGYPASDGFVNNDPDLNPDPIGHTL